MNNLRLKGFKHVVQQKMEKVQQVNS